jgi:hypothetical protein
MKVSNARDLSVVEFGAFLDGLIRDGKVLPAEKDGLVSEFGDTYRASSSLTFAAGEKDLVTKFKDRLSARVVTVKASGRAFASASLAATQTVDHSQLAAEFASVANQIDPVSLDLDAQIEAYAAANKCSYEVAAIHFGAAGN